MTKITLRHPALATAILLGGLSLAQGANAAPPTVDQTMVATAPTSYARVAPPVSNAAPAADTQVEGHIKGLHDRLMITPAQEKLWANVADAMRDNANEMHDLIQQRHQMAAAGNVNAIDDLKSYEKIAAAHAEGIKTLIPAFRDLYENMTPAQQANADKVFSRYEGHDKDHGKKPMHHHHANSAKPATPAQPPQK